MPFLPPNQQRQSTEGKIYPWIWMRNFILTASLVCSVYSVTANRFQEMLSDALITTGAHYGTRDHGPCLRAARDRACVNTGSRPTDQLREPGPGTDSDAIAVQRTGPRRNFQITSTNTGQYQ